MSVAADKRIVTVFPMKSWRPKCVGRCGETFSRPPAGWNCPNGCGKTWQPYESASGCAVCGQALGVGDRKHCSRCGNCCCGACGQYLMVLPGAATQEKERVCKGCAFPATPPDVSGPLMKVSRDEANKETGRNVRFFQLRNYTLLYADDEKSTQALQWKGIFDLSDCNVSDSADAPALGFVLSGGRLPHPINLVADTPATKSKWVSSIVANAQGGTGVGGDAYESTEADGTCGWLRLLDPPSQLYFLLKGTELRMAKDNLSTAQPLDVILLHGGTTVQDAPGDAGRTHIMISGPRLAKPIYLVCANEEEKADWKRQLLCAQRGGKSSTGLPPITMRTMCEGTQRRRSDIGGGGEAATAAAPATTLKSGPVELREPFVVFDSDVMDLRGATVSVDPSRAHVVVLSGAKIRPSCTLRFSQEPEFAYWKSCMQAAAAGKALPIRSFPNQAPLCSGFLTKVGAASKGSSSSATLNKRYFRLFDNFLQYSDDASSAVKGEFDVLDAEVDFLSNSVQYKNGLSLTGPRLKRSVTLVADTAQDAERWRGVLLYAASGGTAAARAANNNNNINNNSVNRSAAASPVLVSNRRKGIGLAPGTPDLIDLVITIDVSYERQDARHPSSLRAWHGVNIPLTGIDVTSVTIDGLRQLIENVLLTSLQDAEEEERQARGLPPLSSPRARELVLPDGVLFFPGRYIAFRKLLLDENDVLSPAAQHLEALRADADIDDIAHMMHRLPDDTFLDEVPLRHGDKLVWRDLPPPPLPVAASAIVTADGTLVHQHQRSSSPQQQQYSLRSDRSRVITSPVADSFSSSYSASRAKSQPPRVDDRSLSPLRPQLYHIGHQATHAQVLSAAIDRRVMNRK